MSTSVAESLRDTIKEEGINIGSSVGDGIINLLMDSTIVDAIPFLAIAKSVYGIGKSVRERNHIKQLYQFIDEMRNNLSDEKKRDEFLRKFSEKGLEERNKELEYVILITTNYIGENKSDNLGRLYLAFISGEIDWDRFVSYSQILDRFLPGDIETLERGEQRNVKEDEISDSLLRLLSLGLFTSVSEDRSIPNYPGSLNYPGNIAKTYQLTSFGSKMRNILGFTNIGYLEKTISSLDNSR